MRISGEKNRWHMHCPDRVLPPLPVLLTFVSQASPEKKKDGSLGLGSVVVGGLAFQVWPEGLQQSWVQLLSLV